MQKPSDVVAALVTKLRSIPELVAELSGEDSRIYAYEDVYPTSGTLIEAIYAAPSPSVMVAYSGWALQGTGPIQHAVSVYVRPAPDGSYIDLTRLMVYGVPAGQPLPMINCEINDNLDPMELSGGCTRQTDEAGFEYWLLTATFNEKWG